MTLQPVIEGWSWLGPALVPLGILALYFLRLRRKPLLVPSTFLWKKSIEDLHVNSLWQRLRKNLLLLLQLLVAALALFALARPLTTTSATGQYQIIMIDNSASMSATDVTPSRLDEAKRRAKLSVDQLASDAVAMVVAFNENAQVMCSYTSNPASLRQAIDAIRPSARRSRLHEPLVIAAGLANPLQTGKNEKDQIYAESLDADVHLYSDGQFPPLGEFALGNLRLHYSAIGKSANNVGILALAARRSEQMPDKLELFARVKNFGTERQQFAADLFIDGQSTDAQRLDLAAGQEQPFAFRLSLEREAIVQIKLDVNDDWAIDNVAWLVTDQPQRRKILIVGDENLVLKSVLQTDPIQKLALLTYAPASFAEQELADSADAAQYDLILFDRCSPKSMPSTNCCLLGALPPALAEAEKKVVEGPVIVNWNASHPVLRYLSLDDVRIVEGQSLAVLPATATPLIETNHGAMVFSLPRGVFTDVVQTFPLIDAKGAWKTDWPLRASFPMYVLNLVQALTGGGDQQRSFQPGDTVIFRLESPSAKGQIMAAGQKAMDVQRTPAGSFEFIADGPLGMQTFKVDDQEQRYTVNLFDEQESTIAPAEKVEVGETAVSKTASDLLLRREYWRWLMFAAFVLLLVEWFIYNRRVYV